MAQDTAPARRPLRRAAGLVVDLGVVAVVVLGLAYLATGFLGLERYAITSGSMSGTFETGSVVLAREVPVADLEVGDVITYLPPSETGVSDLVTHRITEITVADDGAREFVTKGDANLADDPWAFRLDEATQPVVVAAVPALGHLFLALANPTVRLLLVGVPAAILTVLAAKDLVRALRRPTREPRTVTP